MVGIINLKDPQLLKKVKIFLIVEFRKQGPWMSVVPYRQRLKTWHWLPFLLFCCPAFLEDSAPALVVRCSWNCSWWGHWTGLHFPFHLCIFCINGRKHLGISLLSSGLFSLGSKKGSEVYSSQQFNCRRHKAQLHKRPLSHISRSSQSFCKSSLQIRRKLPDWMWGCLLAEVLKVEQLPIEYQMNT